MGTAISEKSQRIFFDTPGLDTLLIPPPPPAPPPPPPADGVGVVVSTHDLSLARDVCSRACVIASRLVALGPVDEALAPSVLARAYGSSADEAIAALS